MGLVRARACAPTRVLGRMMRDHRDKLRPFLVGFGQSPHLVGGQAKITEHRPERLATADRVEELLPRLDR